MPLGHIAVAGGVLFLLLSDREVATPGNQNGGDPGVYGIGLVHIRRQLSGVCVQQTLDLLVVHGVDPSLLTFCKRCGLVYTAAVFLGGTAKPVIGETVYLFGPLGGVFIYGIVNCFAVISWHFLTSQTHSAGVPYPKIW